MTANEIISSIDLLDEPEKANGLLKSMLLIAETMNNSRLSYVKRFNRLLKIVLEYLDVEQGSIMILERKNLVIRAATRPDLLGLKQPVSENSVAGWVAESEKALFIADISKDKRFQQRPGADYKKNSLLSVPIHNDRKLIGVFNVTDKTGSQDLLREDINYLLQFSSIIIFSLIQGNLHQKIKKQRTNLKKKNRELRKQEKLRKQLSRLLIHDLKTPLAEVVANLDILSYSIQDDNSEFVHGAQIGCDRAVRMVSNLASIDQIEGNALFLLKEQVSPKELLAESLSSIKALARMKSIALIEQSEELPVINLDRTMILRVLQNLLTNGLSYSDPGSTIRAGCRAVSSEKEIEFYVTDQGPGISENKQGVIFDKFARIAKKHDALVGSGLGLYFCKLAVEEHKGKIGLESHPGKGCRFFFTLPL